MNYFDLYDQAVQPGLLRDQHQHELILAETAQSIAGTLTAGLQELLGQEVDFSCLTMPLAFLAIYQIAPGRHEAAGSDAGVKSFASYKDLAAVCPGDETHALMSLLLESSDPDKLARDLLEHVDSPEVQIEVTGSDVKEVRQGAGKVGVSFGMSFLERLGFRVRLPGQLCFLRGRDLSPTPLNSHLRLQLLESVTRHFPSDRKLRSVIIYLVLTMPVFMLEGFGPLRAKASKLASGLRALVVGTEFQRKPLVSMLIAVMKFQGKQIIGIQHGGGYGQTDPNWWERAERCFCDRYRTWGYQLNPGDESLPSIKLSRQGKKAKNVSEAKSYTGIELRVLLAIPYISEELECSLYSPPYQSQVEAVEKSLEIIAPLLERDCKLTVRIHPKNKGAAFIENLSVAAHPKVEFSAGVRGSIAEDASNYSALFFSSPQATGIAECLASGRVFYVAASPDFFWIRSEVADQYREMQRCGIWLTRFDEVEDRMQSGFASVTHRQQVFRYTFAKTFACHSDSYRAAWIKMLRDV